MQLGVPVVVGQAMEHCRQWAGSLPRLASQPFAATPSQSPNPLAQFCTAHAPPVQVVVAWSSAQGEQSAAPQPRAGSVVETHCPEQALVPTEQSNVSEAASAGASK